MGIANHVEVATNDPWFVNGRGNSPELIQEVRLEVRGGWSVDIGNKDGKVVAVEERQTVRE
jgi:hypothetical protein